jgi:hypothetical protein
MEEATKNASHQSYRPIDPIVYFDENEDMLQSTSQTRRHMLITTRQTHFFECFVCLKGVTINCTSSVWTIQHRTVGCLMDLKTIWKDTVTVIFQFAWREWMKPIKASVLMYSSGQSSWLQIQRSGLDFRRYCIFWEVVGLERGTLSLASTIEKLLERKSSGSGLQSRDYGRRDPPRWRRGTIYPQKLSLTSPTSCGRSVGIVLSRTKSTELLLLCQARQYINWDSKRVVPNRSLEPDSL